MVGEYLRIEGGKPLKGRVKIPAAKNSVLPLMAAALMCSGESYFTKVPELSDVQRSVEILQALGCCCQKRGRGLAVRPGKMTQGELPEGPAKAMRSSVFYLAPALHRFGRVQMPLPGGCRLGPRPIDIHLDGLCRMGAHVSWQGEDLVMTAPKGLNGVEYTLRLPSVGATETLLMAGVLAKGETVLRGAAREPEICDLADFLRSCGAHIAGEGTSVIRIRGVQHLQGAVHTPIPDRIVGITAAAAVAAAGGRAELLGCKANQLGRSLELLKSAGCEVVEEKNGLVVERSVPLKAVGEICTGCWPGFSTDAAPIVAAALLTATGASRIEDRVFEHRFACAEGFCAMGAKTKVEGRALQIGGVTGLHGAEVWAEDLRGGAALMVAALAAEGESRIRGLEHILRGYEHPDRLLRSMGVFASICADR